MNRDFGIYCVFSPSLQVNQEGELIIYNNNEIWLIEGVAMSIAYRDIGFIAIYSNNLDDQKTK